jgi:N-methylhydantoinase A/oxoprolinase/acetone carboxylase beta subunit
LSFEVEFDLAKNGRSSEPVVVAESSLKSSRDLRAALTEGSVGGARAGELTLELIRLRVNKAMPAPRIAEFSMEGQDSSHAKTGTRAVGWGSNDGVAQIYRWESLKPGNRIEGCSVIEGINSTQFIPDGWALVMDRFGNATVNRSSKK